MLQMEESVLIHMDIQVYLGYYAAGENHREGCMVQTELVVSLTQWNVFGKAAGEYAAQSGKIVIKGICDS